jgi:replicative DNA helicase
MVTEAVPRDVAAEQAVLSGCMWTPGLIPAVAAIVHGVDFWTGPHQAIWAAVMALHAQGVPADPVLLLDHMRAEGLVADGPYLHTVYAVAPPESAVAHHARIVADCGTRRRMIAAGSRIAQRAAQPAVDIAELTEWAAAQVRAVRDERASVEVLSASVDEFMRSTPEDVDWVVPGLLARADRFVLTGSGGLGKSTMLAQIAVCAAAGIDPLDWSGGDGFDPVRVTVIDCENADHQLKTRLWPMLREARAAGRSVEDRLCIGGHGNPLNLLDPASALSLLRTVEYD